MPKIAPSEQVRQQLQEMLDGGTSETPVSQFLRLAVQRVVQEMLEQEVADYLGRERYERREDAPPGYRNGYEPGRIRSAEGGVSVQVPQVRDSMEPYRSTLMDFLRGNSDVLEELVVQMYTRGLSTRDRGVTRPVHRQALVEQECGQRPHRSLMGGLSGLLSAGAVRLSSGVSVH